MNRSGPRAIHCLRSSKASGGRRNGSETDRRGTRSLLPLRKNECEAGGKEGAGSVMCRVPTEKSSCAGGEQEGGHPRCGGFRLQIRPDGTWRGGGEENSDRPDPDSSGGEPRDHPVDAGGRMIPIRGPWRRRRGHGPVGEAPSSGARRQQAESAVGRKETRSNWSVYGGPARCSIPPKSVGAMSVSSRSPGCSHGCGRSGLIMELASSEPERWEPA